MSSRAGRLAQSVLTLVIAVLAGGFIASALVRYSPGFDVDENSWNPQISAQTPRPPSTRAANTKIACRASMRIIWRLRCTAIWANPMNFMCR